MSRDVIVTGAGGFVGGHLVTTLSDRGNRVRAWTRGDVDLTDRAAVAKALSGSRPDVIYHLAAAGLTREEVEDPATIGKNVAMAANLIESVRPGTTIVAAGTMSEYGGSGVLSETDPCRPTTAYAISKYAAACYLLSRARARATPVRIARLFAVYGPGERSHRLFPTLVRELSAGRPVELSEGKELRDFVHVADAADALHRLGEIESGPTVVLNVGTGVPVSIADACRWVADALGVELHLLRFGVRPESPGDADALVADVGRLRSQLGWVPEQRLRSGLDVRLLA